MNLQRRQIIIILAALVIGLGVTAYAFVAGSHPKAIVGVPATTMNLDETVSTTGTVQGAEDVQLSFQTGGKIATVNADMGATVAQGDVIASLDTTTLQAQLQSAEAALANQELQLNALASTSQSGSSVQTTISNNINNLADKLTDGYIKVDTALSAYTDGLFSNPKTSPVFGLTVSENGTVYSISTTDFDIGYKINTERSQLNTLLKQWNTENQNLTTQDQVDVATQTAEQTLTLTQQLLTDIAAALNSSVGSDATFQSILGSYKASIATARTMVDTAFTNLRTAEEGSAMAEAPVSNYAQALQQTSVQSAEAQVASVQAAIDQTVIRAPFSGIITEQDAKVGQIATPGVPLIQLISKDKLQVETYVSEVDVGKITVGMGATVTLDSYGPQQSWNATVVSVAAGESSINNTNGYKVVLQFDTSDPLIKSGMSANITFEIAHKDNVVAVPDEAIVRSNNSTSVFVDLGNGKQEEQTVVTGISGNGYTEIVSGISPGDKIITFTTTK